MKKAGERTFWLLIGSQTLYGQQVLDTVARRGQEMAAEMSRALPFPLIYRGTVKSAQDAVQLMKMANEDEACCGVMVWCHTFSPAKMWIEGLRLLQKPYCHFATQYNRAIPNDEIDMDFMNLNQAAHGDREYGFMETRMRLARKVVMGYWKDEATLQEIEEKMAEYAARYTFATDDMETVRYQAREELAIQHMLDAEGAEAFSNTFQDLYGMRQLPGLASQNLMANGYGYGGEGDWKVSAMTRIIKAMTQGMPGGTAFMEDYTYNLEPGKEYSLGAHMLEVCPSVAAQRPRIEVHPLGIGDREPPARLVFEGHAGPAVAATLVDMGGRFRLIIQDIECVKPILDMPNLPVARVMWRAKPSLCLGAKLWILAGGAHHSVLSYDATPQMLKDWAEMMGIEVVHITDGSTEDALRQQLLWNDLAWRLKC